MLTTWTIDQAFDAHLALDYIEDREAEAQKATKPT